MLSIVVTVYNGEAYIERCLNSIYCQTFKDYEIICVDDGSSDNSYGLLLKMKKDNMKIIHTENRGVWFARKEGIKAARGDWIGFVDCDDEAMENMYFDMMMRAEIHPEIDMVVCGLKKIDSSTGKIFAVQMVGFGDEVINVKENKEILTAINPSMCNKIFRTHIVRRSIELKQAPRIMEDLIFIGSIFPLLRKVAFCKRPYYLYYDNRESVTKSIRVRDLNKAQTAILSLKECYKTAEQADRYLLDLLTILHVGVAFTINMNHYEEGETAYTIWKDILNFLEENFSAWKRNPYMTLVSCVKWKQLRKIYMIYSLFDKRLYLVFVRIYHFGMKKLNMDIKW